MDPWHRILIRGIFFVILAVGVLYAGASLAVKLPDGKRWIGGALLLLGVGLFFYSLRYLGRFLYDLWCCCTIEA